MIKFKSNREFKDSEELKKIHQDIIDGKCQGNEYLGWVNQPEKIDYVSKIKEYIKELDEYDVMLVLGIGGSYIGTKMAYDFLSKEFTRRSLYFAGWNLSESHARDLKEALIDKKVCVLTISKSGSTLETAKANEYFSEIADKQIVISSEDSKLWKEADENGWDKFPLENNIGGRYSFLTYVSLLPLAFAGFDIQSIVDGQLMAWEDMKEEKSVAWQYANARYQLSKEFPVELNVCFEPKHLPLQEWTKQLFGESEGKNKKGLFPASCIFSTDLHSLGQFIQDGSPVLFETFLRRETKIGLDEYNSLVLEAAKIAHQKGGKTILEINFDNNNEVTIGYLTYFFFMSAAYSACLFGVNPFDQPGVEDYKSEIKKIATK